MDMYSFTRKIPVFSSTLLAGILLACGSASAGTITSMDVVNNGASTWLIDGVSNPPLTLLRGETYEFMLQNVPSNHPFNINTINTTGAANQYNDGVTNNGATGMNSIVFSVPFAAPDSLFYNCGNHSSMNGTITIITDVVFADGFDPVPI